MESRKDLLRIMAILLIIVSGSILAIHGINLLSGNEIGDAATSGAVIYMPGEGNSMSWLTPAAAALLFAAAIIFISRLNREKIEE